MDWLQIGGSQTAGAHYKSSSGLPFLHSPFSFLDIYIAHLEGPRVRISEGISWLQFPLFAIVAKIAVISIRGIPSHPVAVERTTSALWGGGEFRSSKIWSSATPAVLQSIVHVKPLQGSVKHGAQGVLHGQEMFGRREGAWGGMAAQWDSVYLLCRKIQSRPRAF